MVLNVSTTRLLLGPAERADVIVDFSQFAGKTLILYNDAPAPVPAFDPRYDYYTGDPDQTAIGGAPTTPAGLRPEHPHHHAVRGGRATRRPLPRSDLSRARSDRSDAWRLRGRPSRTPIVPEPAYNAAYRHRRLSGTDTYVADPGHRSL